MNLDLMAPQVQLSIARKGKTDLPIARDRIISAHLSEKHRGSSELTVNLDNSDGGVWYIDPLLVKGTTLKFSFGYPGKMRGPIEFKNSGIPSGAHTLQVKALMKSRRKGSDEWRRTRSWENLAITQVVERVAAEMGFSGAEADVDFDLEVHEHVSQRNETDFTFMHRLADMTDRTFWIDETGFHFKIPAADVNPKVMFRKVRGVIEPGVIIEYSLPKTPKRVPRKIKLLGRDPLKRRTVSSTIDMEDKDLPKLSENPIVDDEEAVYVARTFAPTDAATAAEARRMMREVKLSAVKLELTVFGEPYAMPGVISLVRRLADPLDGKWYIWDSDHEWGSGATTKMLMGREGFARRKKRRAKKDLKTKKPEDIPGRRFTAGGKRYIERPGS